MKPLLALTLLACVGCSGILHPGPQTTADEQAVKADVAKLEADLGPLEAQIPGVTTLVAQIGSGNYLGAAATLVQVAPAIVSAGGPAVADARALVEHLSTLVKDAAAGKGVPDVARARAILNAPAASGTAKALPPGPAPANAPGVTTWTGADGSEWTREQMPHAVLVQRGR